mmetsp:Transcript_26871/g.67399  ORF Transcript_26871/g.67399 Transcript_26871/m.67399 type:complete len:84 (-) Transcript_26871:50-301(-)
MTQKIVTMDLEPLKESFERREFILTWTDNSCQLADPMTKSHQKTRATRVLLTALFEENRLPKLVTSESVGSSLPTRIWQTDQC